MISLADYAAHDGLGLAQLVARKAVSAQELADTALAAIAQVNPTINAVLQQLPDQARDAIRAGLPNGPFAGVPFLIKELVLNARGVACGMGSRLADGLVPTADTELMMRFRRAGLLLVGTTQSPEFGYNPTTETVRFGAVHNPWNAAHSAGGSSGGSAAAVAAGITPLAHANDGGGSVRIPAACNGLIGLKPSRDRIPTGPNASDPLCGLACEFAVTRTVRDTAALLDAVAGADIGAPGVPVPPVKSYRQLIESPPRPLRIAWTTTAASGNRADAECERAVHDSVRLLESLGHTLIEDRVRYDWASFLANVHIIWTCYTAAGIDDVAALLGRKPSAENLEAVTIACYEDGKRTSAAALLAAMAHGNALSREAGAFFSQYDVMMTPTLARPPPPLGELDQNRAGMSAMAWTEQVFDYAPFTPLYNTTGQPAISLPLHWSKSGLPMGVQFAAPFGDEATLLQLAAQLEQAAPWAHRRAPIHAATPAAPSKTS